MANWWIYMSLMEARASLKEYLHNHALQFDAPPKKIEKLSEIYNKEVLLLDSCLKQIAGPFTQPDCSHWTAQMRKNQIEMLVKFKKYEEKALKIIKTACK
jgi:hypothetical protein